MRIWRISNYADLSGRGGLFSAGRWHQRGVPVVYCSDHPSTALLETLVHVSREAIPDNYQLIEIEVPDQLSVLEVSLPVSQQDDLHWSQAIGTNFLLECRAALLKVPSRVMPKASNFILNPKHDAAAQISIADTWRYPFDSRLLR